MIRDSEVQSSGPNSFRTIGEVAAELGLPQHVLRFWESKFRHIRPHKRRGGHRYYRPEDVDSLREIKTLLHERGFTIKGAQAHLLVTRKPQEYQVDLFGEMEEEKSAGMLKQDVIALKTLLRELEGLKERLNQPA